MAGSRKFDMGDHAEDKAWIEGWVNKPLSEDTWEWAHDGKILCELVNAIEPGLVDARLVRKSKHMAQIMANHEVVGAGIKKLLGKKLQGSMYNDKDLYNQKEGWEKSFWNCIAALKKLYPLPAASARQASDSSCDSPINVERTPAGVWTYTDEKILMERAAALEQEAKVQAEAHEKQMA